MKGRSALVLCAVLAAAAICGSVLERVEAKGKGAEEDNLRIVRKSTAAWNAHDVGAWASLLDEAYVWETDTLPAPVKGREAARQTMAMYLKAFPDLHLDVEQTIASGSYVIQRWRSSGTHQGEFAGIAPTNRKGGVHGCTITELKRGRIVRAWGFWDSAHLLRQLGVLPDLGKSGSAGAGR